METSATRILLVDDNAHTRLLAKTLLMTMGCLQIQEAEDGQTAVALFQQHQPDLVILDINMPIMDGKEALRQMLEIAPAATIIMWSSLDDENTIRECVEMGASNFIRKHEPLEVFTEMIAAHIQEL